MWSLRICTTCPYIDHGGNKHTFHFTGETYKIKPYITCNTFNVICMIQCQLFNQQYIGKPNIMNIAVLYLTSLVVISIPWFRDTFLAATIQTLICYLSLLKKLSNERDSFRKAREAHIIYEAKTLKPLGINKRDQL